MNSSPLPQATEIRPTRVLTLEHYSEGPVIDSEGNLYFSHGTSISKMAPGGDPIVWGHHHGPQRPQDHDRRRSPGL